MSYLESNMKLLGPLVLDELKTKEKSMHEYVVSGFSERMSPAASITFGPKEIWVQGGADSLYDDCGPFEQISVADGTTYIVFGFGMGYHLDILCC